MSLRQLVAEHDTPAGKGRALACGASPAMVAVSTAPAIPETASNRLNKLIVVLSTFLHAVTCAITDHYRTGGPSVDGGPDSSPCIEVCIRLGGGNIRCHRRLIAEEIAEYKKQFAAFNAQRKPDSQSPSRTENRSQPQILGRPDRHRIRGLDLPCRRPPLPVEVRRSSWPHGPANTRR